MTIAEFQKIIRHTYHDRDATRGLPATFMWLIEEIGELARALQNGDRAAAETEFADALAWLTTLASLAGVDLEAAAQGRYGHGCPKCGQIPCVCQRGAVSEERRLG
jgi:NTP pyrophosphatase (non-canonical NTP hydrolase)